MLLVGLCVQFIASNLQTFNHEALQALPFELRSAVLSHLTQRMKLEEADFSALMGEEGKTPVIQVLDLSSSPYEETGGPSASLLRHIGACAPQLRELRLKKCRVLNDSLVKIMLDALPHLEALYLSGAMNITDKAILDIKDRMGSRLQHLELNTPNKLTSPALNQLLISVPNLRSLSINSSGALRNSLVGVVADDCKELVSLAVLNSPNLTDDVIEYIARGTDGQGGLHKLKSLTLGCPRLTGAHLDKLVASCSQLEQLAFQNPSFREPGAVLEIARLASLRRLEISSSWCLITREILEALLCGCGQLESLSLCVDSRSAGVFQTFVDVPNGLQELTLLACTEPGSFPATISFTQARQIISGCPHLAKLVLHEAEIEALPLALRGLPKLSKLILYFVGDELEESVDENVEQMTEAEKAEHAARMSIREEHATGTLPIAGTSLRKLHLTNLPVKEALTAKAMANIAKRSPKLQVLKLSQQGLLDTDPVLQAVAASHPSLRKVQLYNCGHCTDDGVIALVRACGQKTTGLDLRILPALSDASLEAIFRNCGQLRSLFISQSSQFSTPTVQRLRQEHPHVNIYHF